MAGGRTMDAVKTNVGEGEQKKFNSRRHMKRGEGEGQGPGEEERGGR